MTIPFGAIADDYTGATDLGAMLTRAGLRVLLTFGVPDEPLGTLVQESGNGPEDRGVDAVIVALKSRSIPAADAVTQSLAALESLQAAGGERFFFKYCSTFDSTEEGNIGPVAEALADRLGAGRVLFVPSFPENGRTVYRGHLFVHGKLLNESGMERHPLNPMTDANLVRVLQQQVNRPVHLLHYEAVDCAPEHGGVAIGLPSFVIADATKEEHLETIANEARNDVLVTGGSAIARPLAKAYRDAGLLPPADEATEPIRVDGDSAVLAGSCSKATLGQIEHIKTKHPALRLDPAALASGDQSADQAVAWAADHLANGPVLIYSSGTAEEVAAGHAKLGADKASRLLETVTGDIAAGLVARGVGKLVVAGGETSGAVLNRLGVRSVRVGPEIEPGVPWVVTTGTPRLALALKSGNFGSEDFFLRAFEKLP